MNMNAESMSAAAEHLSCSERGRDALAGLNEFFKRGCSLDAGNVEACFTLLQGFFGAWTGSARDAVAEHLEAGRSK
jgi:hypothetical protein